MELASSGPGCARTARGRSLDRAVAELASSTAPRAVDTLDAQTAAPLNPDPGAGRGGLKLAHPAWAATPACVGVFWAIAGAFCMLMGRLDYVGIVRTLCALWFLDVGDAIYDVRMRMRMWIWGGFSGWRCGYFA